MYFGRWRRDTSRDARAQRAPFRRCCTSPETRWMKVERKPTRAQLRGVTGFPACGAYLACGRVGPAACGCRSVDEVHAVVSGAEERLQSLAGVKIGVKVRERVHCSTWWRALADRRGDRLRTTRVARPSVDTPTASFPDSGFVFVLGGLFLSFVRFWYFLYDF